ncbi:type II toxin-antitoxin system Phd/YefM family antitoxin [Sansalvadorimonas verongulae]|uniref:type II toxin-antitoxin system Phd/YefM family antitoxin n=1 Tax=Sansalvadorimonas verongulae TaxID=2172824 RepID=UPI0012BD7BAA|nr:type II toxin-antitoxin system Phd/YefM family antitoxin [Sansalvadorimonas verongulae]MTI11897.1 type II toxin-antitoxin system Phd/YefM family antitoxin [Sansalvadorimonas verongulae]
MKQVLANNSISISELKKNPSALIAQAAGEPVVVLNHNRPTAYLVPADTYELMMEKLDDIELLRIAKERLKDKDQAIEVDLDDL